MQINGVDMTEARHDQAVALLTGTSPTIALLVEREQGPHAGRGRAHSPPPPEPSDSPEQEEPNDEHANHLSRTMEDEYPIEVSSRDQGRRQGRRLFVFFTPATLDRLYYSVFNTPDEPVNSFSRILLYLKMTSSIMGLGKVS